VIIDYSLESLRVKRRELRREERRERIMKALKVE
jgi:hypothetical protein